MQGFNSQYVNPDYNPQAGWVTPGYQQQMNPQPQYAPWQQANKSAAQPGGGAGGVSPSLMQTLLGFSQNNPSTPQYDLPQTPQLPQYDLQMPGSIQPMELPQMGQIQRPGQLQSPGDLSMPQLSAPELQRITQLQTPGALQMGPSLQMPQLNIPGQLQMPGEVGNPQLTPGVGLGEMANTTLPYQAFDPSMFDIGTNPTAITGGQFPQQGGFPPQGGYPQPGMDVNAGINIPQGPGAPQAGPIPSIAGMSPLANTTALWSAGASLGPQMQQQQAGYLANLAQNNLAGQQAQSQAGLGWGGLGQSLQQMYQNAGTQGQGNMLGFLGGMAGGL